MPTPSPQPSGLRRFARPIPLLIAVAVLVVAGGLIAVFASQGGSDAAAIEQQLEKILAAAPYGADSPVVECPADASLETGAQFECQASAADGSSVAIAVTVESTQGDGDFSIGNLVPAADIASDCKASLSNALEGSLLNDSCTAVECPDLVEAVPNATVTCDVSLESGGTGTISVTLDDQGNYDDASHWSATIHTG